MIREVDINEISDGKRYHANDMVRIGCNDCEGCSKCCHDMGKSIILDPYDIYQLKTRLGKSFEELLSGENPVIELSMADGVLLPNLKMQDDTNSCSLLSSSGRCTIHDYRPGICRLFPLGRIYEEGNFSYFNQIYECDYPNKSKVKIKKWLGINNISEYERYIIKWHDFLERYRESAKNMDQMNELSAIMVEFLGDFYKSDYRPDESIYNQIYARIDTFIDKRFEKK